jgi:hypothetical protein
MEISKTVNIAAFIKFGQKEHILDLYENGTVYCNTLQYFRNHENVAIGDKYEGTTKITNSTDIRFFELTFPNDDARKPIRLNPSALHLRQFYSNPLANLYCLYTVDTDEVLKEKVYKINGALTQFDSTNFLIIHTPGVFIERMTKAIRAAKYNGQYGFVDYYDKVKYNGELSMFNKPNEFAYQKEFRFLLENHVEEPVILTLGSLQDISIILETQDIEKLEFKKNESNTQLSN